MVEDGEGDGGFPNPPCTDEGNGFEVFSESDNLLNQLVTPETVPRGRGRRFTGLGDGELSVVDGRRVVQTECFFSEASSRPVNTLR